MIEIALRYLKAQKEQGGKVTQWEGNKQTARLYVSSLRKILKAMGKDENELIASLTDENIESVVSEIYEAAKRLKDEKKETESVKETVKGAESAEEEKRESLVTENMSEEVLKDAHEEGSDKVSEKKVEDLGDGGEVIRKNVERSIEGSKRFVLERKRRENRSVVEQENDEVEKPKKSLMGGFLTSPWFLVGLVSVVLVAIVFMFMSRKKDSGDRASVAANVGQAVQRPLGADESTALNDMFGELNKMFGAELWRP